MVIKDLWKYYAEQLVFEQITASVGETDRIGLVGANGVGKTTLLRVLAGEEPFERGHIIKGNQYRVGFLEQLLTGQRDTLGRYLEHPFAKLLHVRKSMQELEKKLSQAEVYEDQQRLNRVMKQYADIQQQWENQGGYEYPVQIKRVAFGLGFSESDLEKPLSQFSGGQQMRAQLARLLLDKPDLLLLDEPTNHLDLHALEWLESFLPTYPKAVIVVSHDRYFLDNVVTRVWELQDYQLQLYKGNYTAYQHQRDLRIAQLEETSSKQQEEIAKIEGFIRKFGSGTRARQAKSLEKRLDKIELVKPVSHDPTLKFKLEPKRLSGTKVVSIDDISKSYDHPVLQGVTGEIRRGDRIALLGANGCGKTTLLRILADDLDCQGRIKWGVNVDVGYFSQEITFNHQGTVLDELYEEHRMELGQLRNLLARFLFRGEDVFKSVQILSGGERNRLALAKLLLKAPNLLLLDEPTNHLDIYARSALERALLDFGGTIVFVSHDRYFVDALANKLWILEGGVIRVFEGGYTQYRDVMVAQAQQKKEEKSVQTRYRDHQRIRNHQKNVAREQQQRQEFLEERIVQLEQEKEELETILANPGMYKDEKKSKAAVLRYQQVEEELVACYGEWEGLIDS